MPRIVGGTISYDEHMKQVKSLSHIGYEPHESMYDKQPVKPVIKKPKFK